MGRRNPSKKASQETAGADGDGIWQNGVVRHSAAFESFYKEQKIVPEGEPWATPKPQILPLRLRFKLLFDFISKVFDNWLRKLKCVAEEWTAFLECLQSDLPTAFRVVSITPFRHYVHKFLQKTLER